MLLSTSDVEETGRQPCFFRCLMECSRQFGDDARLSSERRD